MLPVWISPYQQSLCLRPQLNNVFSRSLLIIVNNARLAPEKFDIGPE